MRVLKVVVDRDLLEIDPTAAYWMTIKGLKRILQQRRKA